MDPAPDAPEQPTIDCVPVTRRTVLNRFSAMSAGIFAALARGVPSASAVEGNFACCTLAHVDIRCHSPSYGYFDCPPYYHPEVWYCCYLGDIAGCGECVPWYSSDCYTGPWACSYGWNTNITC
jgi:hypothetical protein